MQSGPKFFHNTRCAVCKADELHTNTHRTDFVGYEHGNRFFNVIPRLHFQEGGSIACDPTPNLRDLAKSLMAAQGPHFMLNEYPEECDHRLYIDIDYNMPTHILCDIIEALESLMENGQVLTLRNTHSGKVHLVANVPVSTARGSDSKKAIMQYLAHYIYTEVPMEALFDEKKWREEIFDPAAGIRAAFSAKVQNGAIVGPDVYAPPDCDVDSLSIDDKARIICEYSIYAPVTGTPAALSGFHNTAENIAQARVMREQNYKAADEYDQLASDFDPAYFLHEWSAISAELYDRTGNDDRWARCLVLPPGAGEAITWLRNMAQVGYAAPGLSRGDMGLAELFVASTSGIKIVGAECYMWDDATKLWTLRDDGWIGNEVSRVLERIIDRRIALLNKLAFIDATADIKDCRAKKERVLSYRGSMDIVRKASPLLQDHDFITKINLQPDLLPARDATVIDLRTGEAAPRLQEHNFTFSCPIAVDRDPAPAISGEVYAGYLLWRPRPVRLHAGGPGLLLNGRVSEKAVFIWWGEHGDNGKSTVMNLMKKILGQYCKSASKSLFIKSRSDSKLTPEREVLKDTRLAVFSETAADDALNDEVLKMASGDDPIRVNPKYRAEFEFRSYAKLLIASNHKPGVNVSDAAMVRRLKFVPFLARFVLKPAAPHERVRDAGLVDRMEGDLLDALFTWLLDSCMRWYAGGLPPTAGNNGEGDRGLLARERRDGRVPRGPHCC